MAAIPSFDIESALAGSVRVIGSINWVSGTTVAIDSVAPYSDDEKLAIVVAPGHGVKGGDRVFLGGLGFMVDGFYEVQDHPYDDPAHPIDKSSAFAIDMPEGLEGNRLTGGKLYRPATYKVIHPDHLTLECTAELKKLSLDKAANLQAQSKYQGVAEDVGLVQLNIFKLSEAAKIKPADRDRFRGTIEALAGISDELLIDTQVAAIKKEFNIKAKDFESEAKRVSRELAEIAKNVELEPEAFTEVFVRRAIALRKREIEILCKDMPDGLMSVLDNMPGMEVVLNSIYEYVAAAMAESEKASEGNEKKAAA